MKYRTYPFRHAEVILSQPRFIKQWEEVQHIISSITEDDIIIRHESFGLNNIENTPKSLSVAINQLLKERFMHAKWASESCIFQDTEYQGDAWRLDFAKDDISVEVAFNHSTVIAWNLIKPVLASELNHVNKSIQTQIGIIITATDDLKSAGGFDSAVGAFEKYLEHLPPLRNLLTVPLLIIGLEAPETFRIKEVQFAPRKKIGQIVKLTSVD